ncbi:MAG: uL15 family ribosomal protein [bacterium]
MQFNNLKSNHSRPKSTVVGRGGKRGKTSGRGGKGQTARAGHKIRPEMRDIIKKLPKRRGYGRNRSRTVRRDRGGYAPVNLAALEATFAAGDAVTPSILVKKGLVRALSGRAPLVKILGTGELTKALSISGCEASASARKAIEAAGGSLVSHA